MNKKNIYYQHSGAIGPTAILLSIIFGLIASLFLGIIYGYIIYALPFIYANFIIVGLYGFGVGSAVGIGAKFGKARNEKVLGFIAFLVGILAFYFGWVSWLHAVTEQNVLNVDLVAVFSDLAPSKVFSMATSIAQKGAWGIFGWTPTGFSLYFIWGIEALMIIFLTVIAATVSIDDPFCERCNNWIKQDSDISPFSFIGDIDSYKSSIEKEGAEFVLNAKKQEEAESKFSEYKLFACNNCNSSQMLSVSNVEITLGSDNKEEFTKTEVIKYLLLNKEQFTSLKSPSSSDVIT
ncbi:MAG: hypothetical protein COB02_14300 [Candidatus Cloacimonadota bacterium]|nr:MAG: hypothetical protein COB02_14300 [Candidatus Cloacimonadota bacterium]